MSVYKNILVALDLHPSCEKAILRRAQEVAGGKASLFLLHTVEPTNVYGIAQAYVDIIDLEEAMIKESKKHLAKLGKKYKVLEKNQFITFGSPKSTILAKATEIKADLLIIGAHGRHGISNLFGSTTTSVVSHPPCDILVVRLPEEK